MIGFLLVMTLTSPLSQAFSGMQNDELTRMKITSNEQGASFM